MRHMGIPGRLFQAGTGRDLNMDDTELETQPITDRLAMLRPIISSGLQAMMDVHGAQWRGAMTTGVIGQQLQQDGGVEAAGESDVPGGALSQGKVER